MRRLAWCGVFAPVLRIGLIIVLGWLDPAYSQARDFISELSARGAPYAAVMSIFGIGLVGVLLILFSVALFRANTKGLLGPAGAACLAVSGVAFVFVALFPCDPGCSPAAPSDAMRMHLVAGTVAMTAQTLAPFCFGLRLFSAGADRPYAAFSLASGSIALFAIAFLFTQQLDVAAPGLVQKVFQVATDLWVFVSAVILVKRS